MCFAVGNQLVLSTAAALETTRNAFFFFFGAWMTHALV